MPATDFFRIAYLADHPSHLGTLARWHHDEWSAMNPGDTVEKRMIRMREHLRRAQIPTTLVALEGDELLGSACLVADDMHRHIDLTPWLASVYVAPAHRRRGIGRALVRRIADEAIALKIRTLYLFTPDRELFYAHMGWVVHQRTTYMNQDVVIMRLELSAESSCT